MTVRYLDNKTKKQLSKRNCSSGSFADVGSQLMVHLLPLRPTTGDFILHDPVWPNFPLNADCPPIFEYCMVIYKDTVLKMRLTKSPVIK